MSTPNGQHPLEPNGASSQATSTVLALDGWGPVVAEEDPPGATNGSAPTEAPEEPSMEQLDPPRSSQGQGARPRWMDEISSLVTDPRVIQVLAPAAAMTIAVIAALKVANAYRAMPASNPEPLPPSHISTLRRRVALAIDPTLTPVEPEPQRWRRWLNERAALRTLIGADGVDYS